MSASHTRKLIEHISDQYVLSAVNPEEAFAREAQKRKKNRAKILAITCATAAVYVLIIVSILIGTRPDTPPEPPTPGTQPGGTTPDVTPPNYTEPDIKLPDAELFSLHLRNFWTTNKGQSFSYIFDFQYDGRVHIFNVKDESATVGRYSVEGDSIVLWTLTEDAGWEKSDISIELVKREPNTLTELLVTHDGQTETFVRMQINSLNYLTIYNENTSPVEQKSVHPYHIEELTVDGGTTLYLELPELDYLKQLEVIQLSQAPTSLSFSRYPSAEYRIYDKNLELIDEGECRTQPHNTNASALDFPKENGLYYLEVIVTDEQESVIYDSVVKHFYAAIQVGAPEPDEPVTPPEDTEFAAPDPSYFSSRLSGSWYPTNTQKYIPYWFFPQPDGRIYIVNVNTGESAVGRYLLTDTGIEIYTHEDGVGWVKQNFVMELDPKKDKMTVSLGESSTVFERSAGYSYSVRVWMGDQERSSNNFYIEEIDIPYRGVSLSIRLT